MKMFNVPLLDTLLPQTKATYEGAVLAGVSSTELAITLWADESRPSVVRRFVLCTPEVALMNPPSTKHLGATARGLQLFELEIPRG